MTLKEKINNKRILFISVATFNYEKEIAKELKKNGGIVDYYDERPSNSILVKGIIRIKRSAYQNKINSYYNNILNKIKNIQYDYLFVIKGEVVPSFFIDIFKTANPKCKLIFYTWDSFISNKNTDVILKYFDELFTFDSVDAKKYNLKLRPLFYLNGYKEVKNSQTAEIKYDLLFLGTAHSDRYLISNKLVTWCEDNGLNAFAFYYLQGKLVFWYKKIFDKSFKTINVKKLSFKSLKLNEILNLYEMSKVVLDIHHPNQSGLTMRTIEAIGAGKKLITTNHEIKKYKFYNSKNICVINRYDPIFDKEFFQSNIQEMPLAFLEAMSINGWLKSIFVSSIPGFWIKGVK